MRTTLKAGLAALICCLELVAADGAAAQTVTLTRDQAVEVARRAWLAGDAALAYAITTRIVESDPEDVEALLLLAASNDALGQPAEAFALGRRAWVAAKAAGRPPALRFEIAETTAHAALSAGQPRRAAYWLERAVDVAPAGMLQSQGAADLQQVKSTIPLTFSGSLRISPTDNLNSGASSERWTVGELYLGTISGWAVDHAGVLTTADLEATYSLGTTPSGLARNALGFGISTTLHTLSAAEAAANPDLDTSELDSWRAAVKWTQDRLLHNRPAMQLALEASQTWFGGVAYSPALRGTVTVPLTRTGDLSLEVSLEQQWPETPRTATSLHLDGHRAVDLPWGKGTLIYGLGGTFLRSDSPNATFDGLDASVILDPGFSSDKFSTFVGIGASWLHYDRFAIGIGAIESTKGRTDNSLWLRAGVGFDQAKLAGLSPTLTLQRQMTWSNISKYQTEATTLYLGLAADF